MTQVFTDIYKRRAWYHGESVSGNGSSMAQTANIREALPGLFRQFSIRSLLDIPCGDFHWMQSVDLRDINYTGADMVQELVDENASQFSHDGVRFMRLDVTCDSLPAADMVLCRDCLVHLPLADATVAIDNIRASSATYLLATTFPVRRNTDIRPGQWRPVNLEAAPFDLGEPIQIISEGCPESDYSDKSIALWRLR